MYFFAPALPEQSPFSPRWFTLEAVPFSRHDRADMENHYTLLGLNTSATNEEIRRAYRILARRYHPDVNPGKASEERFKKIAEAYRILNDTERRRAYDIELENHLRTHGAGSTDPRLNAYRRQQASARPSAQQRYYQAQDQAKKEARPASPSPSTEPQPRLRTEFERVATLGRAAWGRLFGDSPRGAQKPGEAGPRTAAGASPGGRRSVDREISKISLIEVSVTMHDVVNGVKKTVEITEPEGTRKVSVRIPPGVRNGSVVHLRSKGGDGEDLVIIVRVAAHPLLSMHARGLVAEVPISLHEAIAGASVTLPSLDEPVTVKIPPGSQSGTEIRLKGRGVVMKDGERGDLFYRLMVRVPEATGAVGFAERATELERYYAAPVRHRLARTLLEGS